MNERDVAPKPIHPENEVTEPAPIRLDPSWKTPATKVLAPFILLLLLIAFGPWLWREFAGIFSSLAP